MAGKYPTFEAYVTGVQTKVAEEVFRRIVERTPVDTGAARDSWELNFVPAGHRISSDIPYMNRLEHGWSQQAPSGMVRITLMELDDIAETIKRQENR